MDTYHLIPSTINFSTQLTYETNGDLHDHSYFELFYVKSGYTIHSILNSTNERLNVGDAYLICPAVPHQFIINNERSEHRDVLISVSLTKTVAEFIDDSLFDEIIGRKAIKFKLSDEAIAFFERQFALFLSNANSDITRKHYEKVMVTQLLGNIYMLSQNAAGGSLDFRNRCLLSINNHYVDPRAIEFVYDELGYNRIYFSKKFKQEFGTTLTEYVLSLRLNHAAFLLKTSSCSIEECCHAIGLESVSYFINSFKRKYGVTPAKYRKSTMQ